MCVPTCLLQTNYILSQLLIMLVILCNIREWPSFWDDVTANQKKKCSLGDWKGYQSLIANCQWLGRVILDMAQERKLKVQTIKSHWAAIFSSLRQCEYYDFSSNLVLHDFLKSLKVTVERPSILLELGVFLVLHALMGAPYEPPMRFMHFCMIWLILTHFTYWLHLFGPKSGSWGGVSSTMIHSL